MRRVDTGKVVSTGVVVSNYRDGWSTWPAYAMWTSSWPFGI